LGLLALVFLLCLAATALNPYGPRLLLYPLATVRIPVLQTHILEWQSPDFSSPQTLPFLVMLLLLPISLGASRTPARATEMVLLSCWMALALIAVRNVAVFALAAAPVIARHSAAALETLPRAQAGGPRREARGLNAVIGALLILLGIAWLAVQLGPQRNEAYLRAQVPVAAIAALDKMSPAGNLFNDYNWGGYVLWRLFPKFSTFVDGRTDVFSAEVFDDYLTMWSAQNGWEAALERWDVGTVLLPPEAPLVSALERSGWAVPYEDAQAVILVAPAAP
jgi:hypothetical protein